MTRPRSRPFLTLFTLLAILLSLLGSAVFATPAHAAGITVNTTEDEINTDGDCSMREAIQAANTDSAVDGCLAGSGADTITLPAGTYTLTIPSTGSGGETTNLDGDLDITSDLTIQGAGAESTIIQAGTLGYPDAGANGISGLFQISTLLGTPYTVNINDVTIANGKNVQYNAGAGILMFASTLNLNNTVFSGNDATGAAGALLAWGGSVTINNSIFKENHSGGSGGAIQQNTGILNITNSSFLENLASSINGGGAISANGTVTITNSTFANNTALNHSGGGIYYGGTPGSTLTLRNNTFAGNSAPFGGALKVEGTAYLYNNILANSVRAPGAYTNVDCHNYGTIYGNNNLIETDDYSSPCSGNLTNSIIGQDPQLDALNGAAPYVFPLKVTSSAVETGDDAVCNTAPVSALDQRGAARPQGNHCDLGSYELVLSPGFSLVETNGSTDVIEGGVSDAYIMILNNPPTDDVTLTLSPDAQVTVSPSSLTFTHDNWHTPQTVTVTGVLDAAAEGTHTGTIQHTVTTTDPDYSSLSAPDLTANVYEVDLSFDPDPLDLGPVALEWSSSYADVTVTNNGVVAAEIKSIGVTSGDPEFTFTSLSGCYATNVLAPGSTCTFRVFFDPAAVGVRTGQITITTNGATFQLDLTGEGVVPIVSVDPTSLDFGTQVIGTFPTQSVTVTNTGLAPLQIYWGTSITEPFYVWNDGCAGVSLDNNETCTISVYFYPDTPGSYSGELTINSNATPSSNTVTLSGNGIAPVLSLSTDTLAFGDQRIGTTSAAKTVTITNNGNADLVIDQFIPFGEFSLTNNQCESQTLAPTEKCTFGVTFSPTTIGAKDGGIYIPSNAMSSFDVISLSGNGINASSVTVNFRSKGVNDGMVRESSETSGLGGYNSFTSQMISVGDDGLKRQYVGILDFDTSSLPEGAVITGAVLRVKVMFLSNGVYTRLGNLIADITRPFFGGLVTLQNSDFQARANRVNVGAFSKATGTNQWITLRVNTSGLTAVNLSGHTQFRLRFTLDDSNDILKDQIGLLSGNYSVLADRPLLIITYYGP